MPWGLGKLRPAGSHLVLGTERLAKMKWGKAETLSPTNLMFFPKKISGFKYKLPMLR